MAEISEESMAVAQPPYFHRVAS